MQRNESAKSAKEIVMEFIEALERLEIKKEFADSNDVCLLYEMNYREPPVTTFVCGWFHVNDKGKISLLRFVLDPRPLFQQKK